MSVIRWTTQLVLFVCVSTPLFGWGPEGHQIVADIVRSHLIETARRHVRELLGNDDLAAISTWADEIRPQRPETFGWHFVDIPMNSSGFSERRDCYRPDEKHASTRADHHNCVVDRILIFQQTLSDNHAPQSDRIEALKFVVHFVATSISHCTRLGKHAEATIFGFRNLALPSAEKSLQSPFCLGRHSYRAHPPHGSRVRRTS